MSTSVTTPAGALRITGDALAPFRAEADALGPAAPTRLAFAAARLVMKDGYTAVDHAPDRPGAPEELGAWIDWDATTALRARLDALGLGIAEAMDTAQRFAIGWPNASELIRRCGALAPRNGFVGGAGVDHVDAIPDTTALVDAVLYQIELVREHGGLAIVLPMPWLTRQRCTEAQYVAVYDAIARAARGPLLVHWLGAMFLPELEGYFPGQSFDAVMAAHPDVWRGAKLSLLDAALEVRLRRTLAAREQIVLTGDDLEFARLVRGGEVTDWRPIAPEVVGHTRIGAHDVALGDFSHALLGVLDGIAAPASVALRFLSHGRADRWLELMDPAEVLGRIVFEEPTRFYKSGLAFLSWINGLQSQALLANHEERGRDDEHYARVLRAAVDARVIEDEQVAAERARAFFGRGA